MDLILSLFSLAGGLGLFLYGMTLMGTGLKKVAGGKLETILERLSSNPIKGFVLGTIVTAIIQSSSATTVMVIGFVNSGIMKLAHAIGVVIGANVGTTATGWLLSLAGISDSNFFLQLVRPATFAPVVVLIGALIVMFAKKTTRKNIGYILLGFGILMLGMTMMSDATSPFAESEAFIKILTFFSNPFFGLLVGILLTAVIQSSSATVGILQALSITGTISYGMAIPLILGMHIGACVPVLLSGIGASVDGKRTSLVYLYFNLIASILFMVGFYTFNAFFPITLLAECATPFGIAVFNTCFKLGAAILVLPFTRPLEKLVCLTVKENEAATPGSDIGELLDERFLASPGFALGQCRVVMKTMSELAEANINLVIGLLTHYDEATAETINRNEDIVDECEDKLGTYLVKLSSKNLTEHQSEEVSKLLHCIGDFERISDHALNLLDTATEIRDKKVVFSSDAQAELSVMTKAINDILSLAIRSFQDDDPVIASRVEPLEQIIDLMCDELKNRHVGRLQRGICTIEQGFVFSDMLSNYERISDHCSNVAVSVIRLQDELYDTHQYLNQIKKADEGEFHDAYTHYKEEYFGAL